MSKHKKRTATTVVKSEKESNEKLISRFNKTVQASRVVQMAKERLFHKGKPSRIKVREAAVKREEYRKIREKQRYL
jgi:hypothetical protein